MKQQTHAIHVRNAKAVMFVTQNVIRAKAVMAVKATVMFAMAVVTEAIILQILKDVTLMLVVDVGAATQPVRHAKVAVKVLVKPVKILVKAHVNPVKVVVQVEKAA